MNNNKKMWVVLSLVIAALTIWAVASQSKSFSPLELLTIIRQSDKRWLFGSLLAMLGFIWFEGLSVITVCNRLGYKKNPLRGMIYGGADVYFSAITPSASGGQPACAWFMISDGIPGAVTTVALLITLVMYTMALLLTGMVVVIYNFSVFLEFSRLSQIMIVVGSLILLCLAAFFLLLLLKPAVLNKIASVILRILQKLHLMSRADKMRKKLDKLMEDYSLCSKLLFGKGWLIFEVFIWNLCQRLSYYMVTFTLFMATGKGLAMAGKATVVQCLACVGSNCIPVPGAMGAADYMLLDGFGRFLSESAAVAMELLCRGVAFYGSVSTGLVIVIIGYIFVRMRKEK